MLNINYGRLESLKNQNKEKKDEKKIVVNSVVSLKGIVKAVFHDTIHVQIGGKVVSVQLKDFL